MMTDTEIQLEKFKQFLIDEERAAATIEKYRRDVQAFFTWLPEKTEVSKEMVLEYKRKLAAQYKSTSANSMLVALNRFFGFCGRRDLQVRLLKVQRVSFRERSREMSVEEYKRLVRAAREKKDERLSLLIQTLCSTGIRVSEHRCITVEALRSGSICIDGKGKERAVFLPKKLQKQLKHYCKERKITTGPVFITKSGKPLNRCNIWAEMKALCKNAGIEPQKVFPHNLRHLFALTYYRLEKDIVRLADILGHANIETTRIYTSTTEEECLRSLSRMKLLL
ncbi:MULTISPECIES: tyrosine-type recombinase/integrase [Hungatella]|uniref:Tyrosine-type recombinase/integrase n=1 Tax=Hungatella hathewayi TaxID=154046 RepID=A0AAW9WKP8_9FIRM|nr:MULTISPECIES: tyrosine-type recombinase/integrase [Hungatella]MCQ4830756.1 tyrosine-type recombinase/integrase [Hungatella sp. SL.1.14]MCQ5388065.1 tyrosine-type recombinase/integrase [Hungatella hathewayi]MUB65665.1 tyrosine-type recombinase/integrase [Hungatella hathewayi]CUQ50079.1 Site-specific recombinase XerD [Hungatella hathewayi]